LLEADNQSSPSIALLQIFAAIEALICNKSSQKTDTIASFVPTLLKPNSLGRREKGDILGKFYDVRSKVVHGNPVAVTAETRDAARRLAAGVVRAVIRWRAFQVKMNEPTTHKRFLDDLRFASGDGKEVVQVDMDLSDLLPESVNPKSIIDRTLDLL
jgi:hypothetical protein